MLSVTRPLDFMSCSDPGQVFPLAVFDVNVGTDLFNPMRSYMGIPKPKKDVWTQDRLHRHPIVQRREAEPVRRRQAFLRKVREAGDDKKWQTRSDQVMFGLATFAASADTLVIDPPGRLCYATKAVAGGTGKVCPNGATSCRRGRKRSAT